MEDNKFDWLPTEIVTVILTKVDFVVSKFVCHRWNDIIRVIHDKKTPEEKEKYKRIVSLYASVSANHGNIEKTKWIIQYLHYPIKQVSEGAATGGFIELLEWSVSQGVTCDVSEYRCAIRTGALNILEWLVKSSICDLTQIADILYAEAAGNNQMFSLEWLLAKNLQCDKKAYDWASRYGNIQAMDWLYNTYSHINSDIKAPWDKSACYTAVNYTKLESLTWLFKHFPDEEFWKKDLYILACNNELILDWILQTVNTDITKWPRYMCHGTIRARNLNTLKWIIDHGITLNSVACNAAAMGDYREIFEWIYEKFGTLYWSTDLTYWTAYYNHFDTYKWLVYKKCKHNIGNIIYAAQYGNDKIIDWLYESAKFKNFATFITSNVGNAILRNAIINDNLLAVKHLYSRASLEIGHCQINLQECTLAARSGKLEILKYFSENNYFDILSNNVIYAAHAIVDENIKNEVLTWLKEIRNNPPTLQTNPISTFNRRKAKKYKRKN